MTEIKIQYFQSNFGELVLGSFENKLCLCDWRYRKMRSMVDNRIKSGLDADFTEAKCDVISQTISELSEYFDKKRTHFSIPLQFVGTSFQQSVWQELLKIPYGKTASYMDLSIRLANPKAIRAVAAANGANAIAIIVPCHRIIGSNHELIGYAGGLPTKKKLLDLENNFTKPDLLLF